MKSKTFDCVEMKNKGSNDVLKNTQGLTREKELQFWQKGTDELKKIKKDLSNKIGATNH